MVAAYPFLTLSLLFLVPGAVIWLIRPDLRRMLGAMALASLPFAATEFLFYPEYWQPRMLFDLVEIIGFGIEDVLFVVGLAMLTSGVYPAVIGAGLSEGDGATRSIRRSLLLLALTAVAVAAAALARVPMIYGAPIIMVAAAVAMVALRPDLAVPALASAALVTGVYTILSLIFAALIPGIFDLAWNTEHFLDRYVLGIPVEELIYGSASGLVGGIFYPFVTGRRLVRRR